jgi:hypothetical protein
MGPMVGVALPVPDVVDGGGGVCPPAPQPDGISRLLDLRSRAQREPNGKLWSRRSDFRGDRPLARRAGSRRSAS